MMSGATVANGLDGTTNTDKAGNWSLTKWTSTSGSVVDFDASLHDLSGDNKTLSGQIKGVMDQAMIDQIRGKQPFEEFASVGKKDVWTDVSGIFKSNGNAATITNASINLEMVAGATADNLDVVGINNMGGTLNFEGVTNVVVKQNGTAKGENNDYDNNVTTTTTARIRSAPSAISRLTRSSMKPLQSSPTSTVTRRSTSRTTARAARPSASSQLPMIR